MIIVPVEKQFDWRHSPVVLFFIVLSNILIFFLYQSGDEEKIYDAINIYSENNLPEIDWPVYSEWLKSQDRLADAEEYQKYYDDGAYQDIAAIILFDSGFYKWQLQQPKPTPVTVDDFLDESFAKNARIRQQAHEKIDTVSSFAHGLRPNDLHITALFTHQFLHGGVMHLLGNLFFLVICGFAVEAALGHLRFLAFYLLGGAGAGLAFAAMDWNNPGPLVGASGSISAVMAMYLAVFRLKKIEFFYWFFILVGYFRAPALIILPFYVGKEVYQFYTDTGSNIAFMAHAGGFIVGAVLMAGTLLLNPKLLNQEYIEEDQSTDPQREMLNKVYLAIENFQFKIALDSLNELIKEHGLKFDYALLRLNIFRLARSKNIKNCVVDLFSFKSYQPHELIKVESLWENYASLAKEMSEDALIGLAIRLTASPNPRIANSIFLELKEKGCEHSDMKLLALKLQNTNQRRTNAR